MDVTNLEFPVFIPSIPISEFSLLDVPLNSHKQLTVFFSYHSWSLVMECCFCIILFVITAVFKLSVYFET